jgi:BlaI family penicillinase repressor
MAAAYVFGAWVAVVSGASWVGVGEVNAGHREQSDDIRQCTDPCGSDVYSMVIMFSNRELDVMTVLWERGPSTVAEVREALGNEMAYTTVLTFLRILETKGYVSHQRERRAHRYFPRVEQLQARTNAVQYLKRRMFQDSPVLLLSHLLSISNISAGEIYRIRKVIDEHSISPSAQDRKSDHGDHLYGRGGCTGTAIRGV